MKHLDDRFIELNKQLSALEFKEGTESSQQLQQEIQRHIERITQEKTVLLTKKQHFTQQAQDIQHNIDALQNRIQQISTDNPDIVAFVQEIQQALDINDTTKIQAIQSIVTKYL